ncbi:glycosyltransferase involved in cell wall biosynthesis [Acetoanaerobium pronyense]|uniref:Glycosyltransferase involved in cell wall biosynthesis n=1 Tax=Acetoanaerobium pronyense TaxID=1482736 RepID=A0ABS4KJE4_9FIRM|nr:glycosyltransferase family 4 protein [Acetoanaerobium pronyense]MBP2027351.1 glycosyltransferase involved in cell wall biosynthesis [Acetoanaerobium pronyense]
MKVLHVITQKPHSTGSGVYLCGLIEGFKNLGYTQGLVAGISKNEGVPKDMKDVLEGVDVYPVYYETTDMPFKVLGMSDVMPYESTRYRDMDEEMYLSFKFSFEKVIKNAINEFEPDLIISHHLYLLTAMIRDIAKDKKVIGICHGTCLRQLKSHDLKKSYIIDNIRRLDLAIALHEDQKKSIEEIFGFSNIKVAGTGYNSSIFFDRKHEKPTETINIVYTGKLSKQKGVLSLIKALSKVSKSYKNIRLRLIGGSGSKKEMDLIDEEIASVDYKVEVLGRLNQYDIAQIYSSSHIFVLPSFYEGLPIVVIEALASGLTVVCTDIPGVKKWIYESLGEIDRLSFVKLPRMKLVDTPYEEDLEDFEKRLGDSIKTMIEKSLYSNEETNLEIEKISWEGLCKKIDAIIKKEHNFN